MMAAPPIPPTPSSVYSPNPLPLSPSQEAQVRDLYYKRVRTKCAEEIRLFAECAQNKTFTATWKCRDQRHAMNSCMIGYATMKEQDAAREEWFAAKDQRQQERRDREQEREAQKQKHHEWWGLDEQGRRVRMDERPSQQGKVVQKVITR